MAPAGSVAQGNCFVLMRARWYRQLAESAHMSLQTQTAHHDARAQPRCQLLSATERSQSIKLLCRSIEADMQQTQTRAFVQVRPFRSAPTHRRCPEHAPSCLLGASQSPPLPCPAGGGSSAATPRSSSAHRSCGGVHRSARCVGCIWPRCRWAITPGLAAEGRSRRQRRLPQ